MVFLHGAGVAENCGPSGHLRVLASYGFHVFSPCYVSDYGVENCGREIAACRLEAFDGGDRHPAIAITRADSIEERVGNGLRYLEKLEPGQGWIDFLAADGRPQWDEIAPTGHSHGASTAALIGKTLQVERIVLLSGPYDVGQDWLKWPELTEARRYFGLTDSGDKQHDGHLAAFAALGMAGPPVDIDKHRTTLRRQPPVDHQRRQRQAAQCGSRRQCVTQIQRPVRPRSRLAIPQWRQ